ncbi:hypothetical protein Agub_g3781, partial [Astrephomene gubernaculifera]
MGPMLPHATSANTHTAAVARAWTSCLPLLLPARLPPASNQRAPRLATSAPLAAVGPHHGAGGHEGHHSIDYCISTPVGAARAIGGTAATAAAASNVRTSASTANTSDGSHRGRCPRIVGGSRYYNYLLVSESTQRTYNGITNDLGRRLRQHRGELSGGARSTRTANDWTYLAVVHDPAWDSNGSSSSSRSRSMSGSGRKSGSSSRSSSSGNPSSCSGSSPEASSSSCIEETRDSCSSCGSNGRLLGNVSKSMRSGSGSGSTCDGKASEAAESRGAVSPASFEWHLKYPTGRKPRPARFSGPTGRLASFEPLLERGEAMVGPGLWVWVHPGYR